MDAELDSMLEILVDLKMVDECPFYRYFSDTGEFARTLYPKQMAFFAAGKTFMQRLFCAANRIGKSEAGAYEMTCHLTGEYPSWWGGRRFEHPVEAWACGTNSETVRDIVQGKMLGRVDPSTGAKISAGMIPEHLVEATTRRAHGLAGSVESAYIKHKSGGLSTVGFKTYEQGRKSFEGTAKHVAWLDEEPPEDVFIEVLYRLATTNGIAFITFTPLQGMSNVVTGFMTPKDPEAKKHKNLTMAGWDDVPHLTPEMKSALIATTPPFQREARTKGIPQLGAGAIYAIEESTLKVPPFAIPATWKRCFGLDAGGGAKATAIAWAAIDPISRCLYITDVYKRESPELAIHIAALKAKGDWIPGVGDAAALVTTADDAEQIISVYRRAGIDIQLPNKAVETGIQMVWELMTAGLFKVFSHCEPWFEEFRLYHRDEQGRIVKTNDHVLDASRYIVISGVQRAKVSPLDRAPKRAQKPVRGDQGWMQS